MLDENPVQELEAAIDRMDSVIHHQTVDRAIHQLLDVNLEAANGLEDSLERAGYARTQRGDWIRA